MANGYFQRPQDPASVWGSTGATQGPRPMRFPRPPAPTQQPGAGPYPAPGGPAPGGNAPQLPPPGGPSPGHPSSPNAPRQPSPAETVMQTLGVSPQLGATWDMAGNAPQLPTPGMPGGSPNAPQFPPPGMPGGAPNAPQLPPPGMPGGSPNAPQFPPPGAPSDPWGSAPNAPGPYPMPGGGGPVESPGNPPQLPGPGAPGAPNAPGPYPGPGGTPGLPTAPEQGPGGGYEPLLGAMTQATDPQQRMVLQDQLARTVASNLQAAGHEVSWDGQQLMVDGRAYVVAGDPQTALSGPGGDPWGSVGLGGGYAAPTGGGQAPFTPGAAGGAGQRGFTGPGTQDFAGDPGFGAPGTQGYTPYTTGDGGAAGQRAQDPGATEGGDPYPPTDAPTPADPTDPNWPPDNGPWDPSKWPEMPGKGPYTPIPPNGSGGDLRGRLKAGMSRADLDAWVNDAFASQGKQATDRDRQAWWEYWTQWGQRDPGYFYDRFFEPDAGPEGGGGGAGGGGSANFDYSKLGNKGAYSPGSFGDSDPRVEQLADWLAKNPMSMGPDVVAKMKAASAEEAMLAEQSEDEAAKRFGFATGQMDSPWLASERASNARSADQGILANNRNIDITAAKTNQQDMLNSMQSLMGVWTAKKDIFALNQQLQIEAARLGLSKDQLMANIQLEIMRLSQQDQQFGADLAYRYDNLNNQAYNQYWG